MDATTRREHREIVGAAAPRREFLPALARVAQMRVRIDESRHHDAAPDILVQRAFDTRESLVGTSAPGRDDHPVARGDESVGDRTHVSGRRPYPRTLILQRLERQQTRAAACKRRRDPTAQAAGADDQYPGAGECSLVMTGHRLLADEQIGFVEPPEKQHAAVGNQL